MKPWTENRAGSVALMLPRCGAACWACAEAITSLTVPPPKLLFSVLKLWVNPPLVAKASTMNVTIIPNIAIRNAPFCQRNVDLVPRMRMRVCSATITRAPATIQAWLVSNELPQLISVWLCARLPPATSAGPRAKIEKNFAKYAAPSRPPMIMHRLEISASGGLRMRLTHT